MNFDDYENLPDSKLSITLFAGACAGIMEHIVMYPVDTIKVISVYYLKKYYRNYDKFIE